MDIIGLLGKSLKSKLLNDFFELYDVDVVYEYDRLNEGISDSYSASISQLGLEFSFDSDQVLKTVFVQGEFITNGVEKFTSVESAIQHCHNSSLQFKQGSATFLGKDRQWIKIFYTRYTTHYEFQNSRLQLVTFEVAGA